MKRPLFPLPLSRPTLPPSRPTDPKYLSGSGLASGASFPPPKRLHEFAHFTEC